MPLGNAVHNRSLAAIRLRIPAFAARPSAVQKFRDRVEAELLGDEALPDAARQDQG